jgi:hypothetical protein
VTVELWKCLGNGQLLGRVQVRWGSLVVIPVVYFFFLAGGFYSGFGILFRAIGCSGMIGLDLCG